MTTAEDTNNKLIVCNWKMNGSQQLVDLFINNFSSDRLVIAFPDIFIAYANSKNPRFKLAAQDCSVFDGFGAHTGEISAAMLHKTGVNYVILGHSEQRSLWDNADVVFDKLSNICSYDMVAILCVSEAYETQISSRLAKLIEKNQNRVILAYEPLSAIGTGITQEPDKIQEITSKLKIFGCNVFYGGSVTSLNAGKFLSILELDGLLIGRAGLNPDELSKILASSSC
jgi:triosephosphate isomerase